METATTETVESNAPSEAVTQSAPAEAGSDAPLNDSPDYGDPGDESGTPEGGEQEKPFDLSEIPGIGGLDQQTLVAQIQKEMQANGVQTPAAPQVKADAAPTVNPLDDLDKYLAESGYDDVKEKTKAVRDYLAQQEAKYAQRDARASELEKAFQAAEKQAWEQVADRLSEEGFERYVGKSGARTPAQQAMVRYIENGTKLLARQYGQFMPPDKINPVEIAKQVVSTLTQKTQSNPMSTKIEQVARTAKTGQAARRMSPSSSVGGVGKMTEEQRIEKGRAEFEAARAKMLGKS